MSDLFEFDAQGLPAVKNSEIGNGKTHHIPGPVREIKDIDRKTKIDPSQRKIHLRN